MSNDASTELARKPLLVFLHGVKASESRVHTQYKDLSCVFELRVAHQLPGKFSFEELACSVEEYVRSWHWTSSEKVTSGKSILVGEGFGGLLALGVARRAPEVLQGVVVVNPATSFHDSVLWKRINAPPLRTVLQALMTANNSVPLLTRVCHLFEEQSL